MKGVTALVNNRESTYFLITVKEEEMRRQTERKLKEDFWKLPLNTLSGVNNALPAPLRIKTEFSTAAHIGLRLIFVYEPATQL